MLNAQRLMGLPCYKVLTELLDGTHRDVRSDVVATEPIATVERGGDNEIETVSRR